MLYYDTHITNICVHITYTIHEIHITYNWSDKCTYTYILILWKNQNCKYIYILINPVSP